MRPTMGTSPRARGRRTDPLSCVRSLSSPPLTLSRPSHRIGDAGACLATIPRKTCGAGLPPGNAGTLIGDYPSVPALTQPAQAQRGIDVAQDLSRNPVRRIGHAAVAAVARSLSQTAFVADRPGKPAGGDP